MKHKKLLIVFFVIIILAISGFVLYTRVRVSMGNSILGPVGVGIQGITRRRQEQGKMIRIYFWDNITDDQALNLMNEWKELSNINGSSFTSSKISGMTIVDLFVVDIGKKQDVIQVVEQNGSVRRVIDGKELL